MTPVVDVYLSSGAMGCDRLIGRARFNFRRGRLSTSFAYDEGYMQADDAFSIDPSLPLSTGSGYVDGLPGALRDSAPDRWGRHLIVKRYRSERGPDGVSRMPDEVDFLLGVHDDARQGALRYALPGESGRLSHEGGVPPRVELPRLMAASNEVALDRDRSEDVKALLDAGSGSLGGARPKASVRDGDRILLAKFSHPGDEWRVMAWERFALDVAAAAGLPVPWRQLVALGDDDVLLLERFDREGSLAQGMRVPYMSAMTLLGAADGERRDYAEVAEAIPELVDAPEEALRSLFVRATLSIALHNTDDHLRNLGFVRMRGSWRLAPCFDINPNPDPGEGRATTLLGEQGSGEVVGLQALAEFCGLSFRDAAREVSRVLAAMWGWRSRARRCGCEASEAGLFAPVFEDRCAALREAFALS